MERHTSLWLSVIVLMGMTCLCSAQVDSEATIYWVADDMGGGTRIKVSSIC